LMSRYRRCLPYETECGDTVVEQKTCESQVNCENQSESRLGDQELSIL
jgi:hypothetical protein